MDMAKDNEFIELSKDALESGRPVVLESSITNLNRTAGTMLSYEVSSRFGEDGLPDETIHIKLKGHAGQSFGFTLAKGIFMDVEGDANDGTGKGLSGGKIAVYPSKDVIAQGFVPEDNVIVGNVACFGATSGKAFFRGIGGERFCVRNSGALAVVAIGGPRCRVYDGGLSGVSGSDGEKLCSGHERRYCLHLRSRGKISGAVQHGTGGTVRRGGYG